MLTTFKNKAMQGLAFSTLFEVIGISFFNIILLLLAKSSPTPTLWVTIVSIVTVLPGFAAMFLGKVASAIDKKGRWIISLTFLQSLFFILLAILFRRNQTFIGFAILMNLISNLTGNVIGLMKLPIIQQKVEEKNRRQALGIYQSIPTFIEPIGQALGVTYISMTHNYVAGSLINAGTFFISACLLFIYRQNFNVNEAEQQSEPTAKSTGKVRIIDGLRLFGKVTHLPTVHVVSATILVNALGSSIDGILTLYVLGHPYVSPFNFGFTILLINLTFVLGNVLGSVLVNDPLKHVDFKGMISLTATCLLLLYLVLFFNLGLFWILFISFSATYLTGKLNPQLSALMMANTDAKTISSVMGILTTVVMVAAPIGSVLFVGGYSIIGKNNTMRVCAVIAAAIILLLQSIPFFQEPES